MDWLANAFWARIGWAVGEFAIFAGIIGLVALVAVIMSSPRLVRQARCQHARYFETGKCDAVCSDCGKNLGFIGTWRERLTRS